MTFIRNHHRRIGIFLAAMIFVAGGLPGLVAAAQGVQIQAPLCTPGGPEPAEDTGSTHDNFDHCQICPLAHGGFAGIRTDLGGLVPHYAFVGGIEPTNSGLRVHVRAELAPVNGRAPPFPI